MKRYPLKKMLLRRRRKKESLFKYTMGLLHLWFGLLSGIVIVLVCLTGCLYAFKNQFTDLMNSEVVFVTPAASRLTASEIEKMMAKDGKELTSIVIPHQEDRSYVVSYNGAGAVSGAGYFNPYTAKDLGIGSVTGNRFFEVVLDLHKNLGLGNVGRQINGVAVLMFCILLLSGFVLWLPKKVKHLKQAFTVKCSASFQRINYDLHNTLGFYACIFLFFLAVTGLYVTYPWVKNALIVSMGGDSISNLASADTGQESSAFDDLLQDMLNRQNEKKELKEVQNADLNRILAEADRILPYSATTTLELPNKDNPRFVVTKINTDNLLGAMLPDQITFDRTGVLKSKDLFWDKPLDKQFTSLAKPLHTGEILGLKSIILYFIICFIGFSLPVTGFIFWWNRVRKIK